jgi:hypothetical protein
VEAIHQRFLLAAVDLDHPTSTLQHRSMNHRSERALTLRQADQARTDFALIKGHLRPVDEMRQIQKRGR